jgi:hypothetical protein
MKPHCFVWIVRLGCRERTNPVLRCFVNPEGMNCRDLLVGMSHEFIELTNSLRLSTDVPSQDLSGAWVTIRG